MRTTTESLVGVTEFGRSPSKLIERAENGERIVILRNNQPTAVIIDVATAHRVDQLEEIEEDLKLLIVTMIRTGADNGNRTGLDDSAAELGIDPSELD